MAKIVGRLSTLEVSDDDGVTYVPVGGVTDLSMAMNQAEIATTSHDDADWESYLPGRKDVTLDVGMRYDEADAGQVILMAALYTSVELERVLKIRFRMETGTGKAQYIAKAFVSSISPSGPNDDAASMDASFRIAGEITKSAQT